MVFLVSYMVKEDQDAGKEVNYDFRDEQITM